MLAKGKVRCIGATSCKEYHGIFAKDAALLRRFIRIDINEPSLSEATKMLRHVVSGYSKFHAVNYTDEALRHAVILADRFIGSRFLPDKALDVVDEAGSFARLLIARGKKITTINRKLVEKIVSQNSSIPCSNTKRIDYVKIKQNLISQIRGQNKSIEQIVDCIAASKFNISCENRPNSNIFHLRPNRDRKNIHGSSVSKRAQNAHN